MHAASGWPGCTNIFLYEKLCDSKRRYIVRKTVSIHKLAISCVMNGNSKLTTENC